MNQKEFLAKLDQPRIVDAIAEAELQTSGEIRVHVQPKAGGDLRTVAERTFERLGMTKTALRTGVLLFIACEEQRFVILGDQHIDESVPAGFWDEIAAKLTVRFKNGEFTDGIVEAIRAAGDHLREFFPRASDDVDELPNDLSIDA
ncbi:MAG: TPM domain-containing protein [Acidobacteria bacterium]|nr:TPM domain-containing protein [Acidobacteriota bacterium]MBV9477566.1 TPM domain-containing protein [Acidobacteriota bacterium]